MCVCQYCLPQPWNAFHSFRHFFNLSSFWLKFQFVMLGDITKYYILFFVYTKVKFFGARYFTPFSRIELIFYPFFFYPISQFECSPVISKFDRLFITFTYYSTIFYNYLFLSIYLGLLYL